MPAFPFDSDTTDWSPHNALALATACDLAYNQDQIGVRPQVQATFGTVAYVPFNSKNNQANPLKEDTQAFLAADKSKIILAFRGTENIRDWMTDFDILPVNFNHLFPGAPDIGHVHAGFGLALSSVWPAIVAGLRDLQTEFPQARLWITGHSLGGGLGVLASAALLFDNHTRTPVSGLYTFGQPRVGLHDFVNAMDGLFKARHYRFVNDQDIVTRIPPRLNGYHQQGRLVFFDGKGHIGNRASWWDDFLRETKVTLELVRQLKGPVEDHSIRTGYVANLQRYLDAGAKPTLAW